MKKIAIYTLLLLIYSIQLFSADTVIVKRGNEKLVLKNPSKVKLACPSNKTKNNNIQQTSSVTSVQKTIKNNDIKNNDTSKKLVYGDALSEYQSDNIDDNICHAFIVQNKNSAYDNGYKKGKDIVKTYISKILLKYDKELSTLFPIESMYIEGILEPPVIVENSKGEFVLEDGSAYRAYNKQYKIIQKAKFVDSKNKKSWKTFLLDKDPDYYKNKTIDNNFKIKLKLTNSKECNQKIVDISKEAFKKGMKDGKDEAILLFKSRLNLLYKYTNSMYLYYRLYIEKELDPPIVGKINTSVYSNNKSLTIGEDFYKILEYSKFNDDVKKWKVYLLDHSRLKEIK